MGSVREFHQCRAAKNDAVLAAHEPAPHDFPMAQPGPTAVLEHGANPGLISHFTKQGL